MKTMPAHLTHTTVISLTHRHTPFTHPWQTFLFYPATLLNNSPPNFPPATDRPSHARQSRCWASNALPRRDFPLLDEGWGRVSPSFCRQAGCFYHVHKHELMRANKRLMASGSLMHTAAQYSRGSAGVWHTVWGGVSMRGQCMTGRVSYALIYSCTHTHSLSEKQAVVKLNATVAG